MLPGFSKNLLAAIKMIESLLGSFQSRIKSVERELWKEYQSLENSLEMRTKKLERLEALVRSGITSGNLDTQTRLSQLETAYRTLKIEHATLQRAHDARSRSAGYGERKEYIEGSPSPLVPTGPIGKESKLPRSSKMTQVESTSSRSTSSMTRTSSNMGGASDLGRVNSGSDNGRVTEHQWMLRLRELEYKLKEEREARQMDRMAARQRIQDSERQNNELAAELVRAQRKKE
ncbi:hypothetical protein RRF57_005984 [Xylaria bambusicola]|uniref:Mto1-like Mto2p-binding domain-containing protein n=1 Tax=Xylaria bambusicola TaxID=326684 RepID=A0AAN7URJ2_9PEZI